MVVLPRQWRGAPDDTKVCYCNEVTLGEIKEAIADGAETVDDVREATGACTGNMCEEKNPSGGCCETDINQILMLHKKGAPGPGGQGKEGGCNCCGR